MNYKIISTGSKGNCVIINDIMVDCGVAFKDIKEELYDIKYLILTHIHSDHIKVTTLNNIRKLFPKIIVIGNWEVHQYINTDIIANPNFEIEIGDYKIQPFECEHDVVTYGYTIEYEDIRVIYATDTSTMENAPDGPYDWLFIESNHDEMKINQIFKSQKKFGYNAYAGAKRHLSTQQCKAFYYMNRRSKDSELIELHQSSRFY